MARGAWYYPADAFDTVYAASDLHGDVDVTVTIFRDLLGVVAHPEDCATTWRWVAPPRTCVVICGDVVDRSRVARRGGSDYGENERQSELPDDLFVVKLLNHWAYLADTAGTGCKVFRLLGNHEVGALRGDERYLHPAVGKAEKDLLGLDQETLYGPAWELGRWLRSLPVLLKLGPILFAHGGPSPELAGEEKALDAFNAAVRKAIDVRRSPGDPARPQWPPAWTSPDTPGTPRLLGRASPIWYRGLLPGAEKNHPNADDEQVGRILATFQVRLIVVGHTTQSRGITAYRDGKVHAIDANLQAGGSGQIWLFQGGRCYWGLPDGRTELLRTAGAPDGG